jgi:hypothetical protein
MKILQVIDMHYSNFIFIVDELDPEAVRVINEFVANSKPKPRLLFLAEKRE